MRVRACSVPGRLWCAAVFCAVFCAGPGASSARAAADVWPERPPWLGVLGPDFTLVALPAAEEEALLLRLEPLAQHGLSAEARTAIASGDPERVTVLDANETRVRGRLAAVSFAPVPIGAHLRVRPAVACGARDDAGDWDLCIDRTSFEYWREGMPHPVRVPRDADEGVLERILAQIEAGAVRSRSGVPVNLRGLVEVAPESPLDPSHPILLRVRLDDALGPRWDSAHVELAGGGTSGQGPIETTTTQLDGEALEGLLTRIRPLLADADALVGAALDDGDVQLAVMHSQSEVQPSGLATIDSAAVVVSFAPRWDDVGGYHAVEIVCEMDRVALRPLSCRSDVQYTSAEQIADDRRGETVSPVQRRQIEAFIDGYRPDPRLPAFTAADADWILVLPGDEALAAGDGYAWVRVSLSRSHSADQVPSPLEEAVAINLRPVNPDDPESPFEIAHHLCSSMTPCSIQHAY